MSKNNYNLRGVTFGMKPIWGIHSLTTELPTQWSESNISYKGNIDYQAFGPSRTGNYFCRSSSRVH